MSSSRTRTKSCSAKVRPPLLLPSYSFLAYPPQKERPTQTLPAIPKYTSIEPYTPVRSRHRSSTFTNNIANWIHSVQPGTPASLTPSNGRRESLASSTTLVEFPSEEKENRSHPLESLGYTSAFLSLQGLASPSVLEKRKERSTDTEQAPPTKHTRSLSLFRPRTQSTPAPPSPSQTPTQSTMAASKAPSHSRSYSVASAVTKSKRAKYGKARPPPLATDLALAQFVDGGKVEDSIKRYNEAKAKASGAVKVDGHLVGVSDVWRDEDGNAWRDREEALEYTHLLEGEAESGWVKFRSHLEASERKASISDVSALEDEERRGSVSSQATQDSDLNPRYAMDPQSTDQDDLAAFNRLGLHSPALALPSQSQRVAKHMRKPENLLDPFPVPTSPRSPLTPRANLNTGLTPRNVHRHEEKTRRRPAPLTLAPQSPAFVCPTNPPGGADEVKRAFIQASFVPAPMSPPTIATADLSVPHHGGARSAAQKQSMLNMKGILKAVGRRK